MQSTTADNSLRQKLYRAFSSIVKNEQVEEELREAVEEALQSSEPEILALGAILAGELGVESATERLKQLTSRGEKVNLLNPVRGCTEEVALREVAGKALEKLRSRKVEAELLKIAKEDPERVVRVIVEAAGIDAEELAKRLEQLEGVRVTRVLRLAGAVSIEASALKAVEVADLRGVSRIRKARVFRALGDNHD